MKKRKFLIPLVGLALLLGGCFGQPSEEKPVSSETPPVTSVTTEEPPVSSETPVTEESEEPPVTSEQPSEPPASSEEPVITHFVVKGVVTDLDNNPIADAVVQLGRDNRQADFTAADGSYEFLPEELPPSSVGCLSVIVSHPEYAGKVLLAEKEVAVGDIVTVNFKLEKVTFTDLGPDTTFGGKFGLNASIEVAYSSEAIVVKNYAHGATEWADNHKLEIFIDSLDGTDSRDDSTYRICAWGKLEYTDDTSFQYGLNVDHTMMHFTKYFDANVFVTTIPYHMLGRGTEEVTYPTKGETFGFSIGIWNESAADWDGWGWWGSPATDAQIAYNVEYGTNFIAPEHSQRYVRLTADGEITFSLKNGELWVYVPPVESNLADLDLTTLTYHSLVAPFGGLKVPGGVVAHVSRSSAIALAVKFEFTAEAGALDPYTIEFFLDTKTATTERVDGTTYRFNVMGNGNPALVVQFGELGDGFGNEETKTTVDGRNLYFAVSYEALMITNTDQYGVTFGALKDGWDGWAIDGATPLPFGAAYALEHGSGFVAPEIPLRYVRILSNGAATYTDKNGKFVSRDTLDADGYRVLESNFGGKFYTGGIATKVRHGATGFEFVFTAPEAWAGAKKIELFIDQGLPNAGQDASTRRIDVWVNGTAPVNGVEYTVDGAVLTINVLYDWHGISHTDQIGFTMGIWNEDAKDWDGWGYGAAPFAAAYEAEYGGTFIAPEQAYRYIRLLSDDSLTFTKANLEFYV